MQQFFDKLMDKPETYRRNVAIAITAVISVFIFAAWVVLTRSNLQEAMRSTQPEELSPTEEFKKTLPSLQDDRFKTQMMQQPADGSTAPSESMPGTAPYTPPEFPVIQR